MCGGPIGKTDEYCVVLDASLHNMCSTNSTHDFSMNPVGSLQDFLIDFKGFPSDSIMVPQGGSEWYLWFLKDPFWVPLGFPQFVDLISLNSLRISKCSP